MAIEVGDYVRTKRGIGRITEVKTVKPKMYGKHDLAYLMDSCPRMYITDCNFIKHSKNIIDLIEEGDYVNGKKVYFDKIENRLFVGNDYDNEQFVDKMKINSVVTKEQYKSIEYVL